MNRRDLLRWGVLGGVSGSGCASLLANPAGVGAGELPGFLAELDGALAGISRSSLLGSFMPERPSEAAKRRLAASDALAQATFRSMLLAGSVQELPREQLTDERVQSRLRAALPEFDTAMFGMTNLLEGLSPTQRADVSRALREDASLAPRIVRGLDEEAASFGVSPVQRRKLSNITTQVATRLRLSPDLALSEFTGKVRKIEARHPARSEQERVFATQLASAALWQQNDEALGSSGGTLPTSPVRQECTFDRECPKDSKCEGYTELADGQWTRGVCSAPSQKSEARHARVRTAGQVTMTVGGILMGLGAAGFLIIGAASPGYGWLYGATFGVLVGGAGLIVLIIGALITAFA